MKDEPLDVDISALTDYLSGQDIVLSPTHLGRGEQGIARRINLEKMAAAGGHLWNGRPSVGRWIVAQADTQN